MSRASFYAARRDLMDALFRLSRENQGTNPMSITGATHIAGSIKDKIAQAKARMEAISAHSDDALAKLHNAADAAEAVNASIEAEAADLMAQLGQFTNGGPALITPPSPTVTALPPAPTIVDAAEPKKNEDPV